eukprot:GHRQ01024361.1.p1 GENE.GHRQ01024361.1~~GHRQ01024361.1.p1  ORF type:complete len:212 (+),score=41.13 GHRQ01024361.1:271-906(+)
MGLYVPPNRSASHQLTATVPRRQPAHARDICLTSCCCSSSCLLEVTSLRSLASSSAARAAACARIVSASAAASACAVRSLSSCAALSSRAWRSLSSAPGAAAHRPHSSDRPIRGCDGDKCAVGEPALVCLSAAAGVLSRPMVLLLLVVSWETRVRCAVVPLADVALAGVGKEVSDAARLGCFSTTSAGRSRRPCSVHYKWNGQRIRQQSWR